MPLCGFNQKMLDGLGLFAEGLWEQAIKRSEEDKVSIEESLKQEIKEMNIFKEILAEKDPKKVQGLHGIAFLAQALYGHALDTDSHKESYDQGFARERKLFQDVDAKYYDELRPSFGPEEALRKLGEIIEIL
ncbi:MAG: hypothetical protein JWM20_312 [Patescibacteria group bacterium]|nr:hypothetical protein [Patescibacteria group bacterium]